MLRRFLIDYISQKLFLFSTLLVSLVAILIIFSMFFEAGQFFALVPWYKFLFGLYWSPQTGNFGFIPVFAGTIIITAIAILVALPLGVLCAIYFSEYASSSFRITIRPIIEMLAGIPTVIYGYFAAVFLGPLIRHFAEYFAMNVPAENALSAGLIMAMMIMPFIMVLVSDSFNAVPSDLRNASLALGATKAETIIFVLLPSVRSGIIAALLLAISRAIGETMIVTMAAGLTAKLTFNPLDSVTTVTAQIVNLIAGDQEFNNPKTLSAFALGLTLFILTFFMNIISFYFNNKLKKLYVNR